MKVSPPPLYFVRLLLCIYVAAEQRPGFFSDRRRQLFAWRDDVVLPVPLLSAALGLVAMDDAFSPALAELPDSPPDCPRLPPDLVAVVFLAGVPHLLFAGIRLGGELENKLLDQALIGAVEMGGMVDRGLVDVYFLHVLFEPAPAFSAHMGVGFFYFRPCWVGPVLSVLPYFLNKIKSSPPQLSLIPASATRPAPRLFGLGLSLTSPAPGAARLRFGDLVFWGSLFLFTRPGSGSKSRGPIGGPAFGGLGSSHIRRQAGGKAGAFIRRQAGGETGALWDKKPALGFLFNRVRILPLPIPRLLRPGNLKHPEIPNKYRELKRT